MPDGIKIRSSKASDAVDFHANVTSVEGEVKSAERIGLVFPTGAVDGDGVPVSTDVSVATPMPTSDPALLAAVQALTTALTGGTDTVYDGGGA